MLGKSFLFLFGFLRPRFSVQGVGGGFAGVQARKAYESTLKP